MTAPGATPGPWVCDGAALEFEGARFGEVAYILSKDGEQFYASAANARLIAASPALYDALVEARENILRLANARWSEVEATDAEMVDYIDAALALARGEAA